MGNFDLRKYLAEGRLFEEEAEDSMSVQFTGQTSFPKDAKIAKAAVAQLQSGNPNAPIIKAMGEFGDANKAKAWVEKIGPDIIVKRILDIASRIPTQGLAKKDMPFLPGPPDAKGKASDVEDALTPGGKYNIDFKEAVEPPSKNTISPGSEEAEDYMTSGVKDGNPNDDSVTVKVPAAVAASDAKPTQTNILLGKSLSMAIGGVEGGNIEAWIGTDGSILDGHHRWAATMLNNPGAKLGAAGAIDMNAMGDQTTALKHLTAIGNALGNKTKTNENKTMKKTLLTIIATTMLFGCIGNEESQVRENGVLRIHEGYYAFCGASGAEPTGNKIIVQGVEFEEGCSVCPVLTGPSISNLAMKGVSPSWAKVTGTEGQFDIENDFQFPGDDGSTVWNGSAVWSLFWYFSSTDTIPQYNPVTQEWEMLSPGNRSFTVNTDHPATSESNMFCMPCQITETTDTGILLANCYGPLNEAAVPLRKAIPVVSGMKSITAALEGKPYPVGTPVPTNQ